MIIFNVELDKDIKGVYAISLVKKPAIQVGFIKLADEELTKKIKMSIDEEQKIVTGPVLIPNQLIFRNAASLGTQEDGFIKFSPEIIKQLASQFLSNEFNNKVDLEHDEVMVSDVKLIESWIKGAPDKADGLGFSDLPEGTWFASYKINNDDTWAKVKANEFNGFSIEAQFNLVPSIAMSEEESEEVHEMPSYDPLELAFDKAQEVVEEYKDFKMYRAKPGETRVKMKRWITMFNPDTCKFCKKLDRKSVEVGKTFMEEYPQLISPKYNHKGCNCKIEYWFEYVKK